MRKSKWISVVIFFLCIGCFFMHAHEGHHSFPPLAAETDFFVGSSKISNSWVSWINGIGRFHLVFLHFPIALIVMTVLAEFLWIWYRNPVFHHAARVMILAAAVFVVPTVCLGFAYSYGNHYEGLSYDLFVWHRYFGCVTAGLAIIAAILKERYVRESDFSPVSYYACLFFLFFSVSLTGAFGGSLTFGLDVW